MELPSWLGKPRGRCQYMLLDRECLLEDLLQGRLKECSRSKSKSEIGGFNDLGPNGRTASSASKPAEKRLNLLISSQAAFNR